MTPYEQEKRYYELAEKWHNATITPKEAEEFAQWYRQGQDETVYLGPNFVTSEAAHQQRMEQGVYRKAGISAKPRSAVIRWLPYAAAVVLVLAVGFLFLEQGLMNKDQGKAAMEILPGGNRATLTLADGRTIDLSEAQTGIVVGNEITYTDGTEILDNRQQTIDNRQAVGKESQGSSVSHLMSLATPKGGTYQITLPDGSKVWLNAASTLRYPSRFDGKERVVELEGEAYFNIRQQTSDTRHQTKLPFKVITYGQTVEVLGTQFNISTYHDDPETKTTLVEGSVQVASTTLAREFAASPDARMQEEPVILIPGQQATTRGAYTTIQDVDISSYTAWKDGLFLFDDESLDVIMRKISRWYDVEVVFADGIDRQERFGGGVSRYGQLQEVLDRLSLTGKVRFAVKERRITVMP